MSEQESGGGELEALLAQQAEHARVVREHKDVERKLHEQTTALPEQRKERLELIDQHRGVVRDLHKHGYDKAPGVDAPAQQEEMLNRQIEQARESSGAAEQMYHTKKQEAEQLALDIAARTGIDDTFESVREFYNHITSDADAKELVIEPVKEALRQKMSDTNQAERQWESRKAALQKLTGEQGLMDEKEQTVASLIHSHNELHDKIADIEGQYRLTETSPEGVDPEEWSKTHTEVVKEGNPLLMQEVQENAEEEHTARDTFTKHAFNRIEGKNSRYGSTPAQEQYMRRAIGDFLSEQLRERGVTYFDETVANGMGYGIEKPRDWFSRNSDREQRNKFFYMGEQLADVFDGTHPNASLRSLSREQMTAHLRSLEQLKAIAEVQKNGDEFMRSQAAQEWNTEHGGIIRDLKDRGFVAEAGQAIMPMEWLRDPGHKDELEQAQAQYQQQVAEAQRAIKEHHESIRNKKEEALAGFREELVTFDLYHQNIGSIDQEIATIDDQGQGLSTYEQQRIDILNGTLNKLHDEYGTTDRKRTSLFYRDEKKEADLTAIQAKIDRAEAEIAELTSAPDQRKVRREQLLEERRALAPGGFYRLDEREAQLRQRIATLEQELSPSSGAE